MRTAPAIRSHPGRSVVETLIVVGIVATMLGLLLGAVQRVRAVAVRARDQNNLRQLGVAVHNYAGAHGGDLPPVRTLEVGKIRFWFGETGRPLDDRATPWQVAAGRGYLMPYIEDNLAVMSELAKSPGRVEASFGGATGGYGYNYRYLAPLTGRPVTLPHVRSPSRTIAFADAATVEERPDGRPHLVETWFIHPPSYQSPSVHFRHLNRTANVLFLDGHVETWTEPVRNPSHRRIDIVELKDAEGVFDIGTTDELWDLD